MPMYLLFSFLCSVLPDLPLVVVVVLVVVDLVPFQSLTSQER